MLPVCMHTNVCLVFSLERERNREKGQKKIVYPAIEELPGEIEVNTATLRPPLRPTNFCRKRTKMPWGSFTLPFLSCTGFSCDSLVVEGRLVVSAFVCFLVKYECESRRI